MHKNQRSQSAGTSGGTRKGRRRVRALWVLPLAGLLIAGLSLEGCSKRAQGDEGDAEAAPSPVPVQIAVARPQSLQPVLHLVGRITLDPSRVATICAPFDCRVASIPATEGQHVKAGTLLVQMDPRVEEAAAAKAAAVLSKSRAALTLLKKGPRRKT